MSQQAAKPAAAAPNKMCKSPKQTPPPPPPPQDKIDYEHLSTNCTVVGSNNFNLVKMSAVPASGGFPPPPPASSPSVKAPPSSPSLKPPHNSNFPVMQIIHNNHPLLQRQSQNIIKIKPHLNILPKPAASPQPSPKPSVSPQIVIPASQPTIMPTAQPLLLNQMPMITTQFILRPQTATKIPATAAATPQGLILQSGGQPLIQLQTPRSQPMVRVLTNGMQLAPSTTTTYVTQMATANQAPNAAAIQPSVKRKPKAKVKKKIDLANLMKLSGIGDEDDIQFESDASQSENEQHVQQNSVVPQAPQAPSSDNSKKLGNIHISAMPQATPLVQVLNHQNFQSQTQAASQIQPFNSFIAPNFTINNGLMLQRSSGGFKLTMGEDGRLVLQHDPTLNQDLQSQLILQGLLGLNGGLVLQPSMDQQTVQQTVQTIQQQSVQTIQQQTVQSQTIQTVQQQTVQPQVQHIQSLQPQIQQQTVQQTIQHQTVQSPMPMQIVQPQPIHSLHSQVQPQVHSIQSQVHSLSQIQSLLQQQQQQHHAHHHHHQPIQSFNQHHSSTPTTQPVLKVQPFPKSQPPVQTVHPQPIIQNHAPTQNNDPPPPNTSYVVNLTPDQLEQLKRNGQLTVNGQTIFMQRAAKDTPNDKKHSPKLKPVKKVVSRIQSVKSFSEEVVKGVVDHKDNNKGTLQSPPPKHILPHKPPQAMVQPNTAKIDVKVVKAAAKITPPSPSPSPTPKSGEVANGPSLIGGAGAEDDDVVVNSTPAVLPPPAPPRITTIQLTPQKQQHLKTIQMQIQALSSRLTPGDLEVQNALKLLFAEQQKILASGKLLPPDKVYYHNNQLTIVNPSMNLPAPAASPSKTEAGPVVAPPTQAQPPPPAAVAAAAAVVGLAASTTQGGASIVPRIAATVAPSSDCSTQTAVAAATIVAAPVTATITPCPTVAPVVSAAAAAAAAAASAAAAAQAQAAAAAAAALQHEQHLQAIAKKAQLVETQLNLDQNGAVKPDIHTPFRDKKDACIRLIRYHCMDQPVLSEKDLDKADEIFELTARHFIGKYAKMVDKYKYLLMKESMRQVQTSELMMLDRMYLAEEQQSLLRLRQEQEAQSMIEENACGVASNHQQEALGDDYDEWACIQRELGCLPSQTIGGGEEASPPAKRSATNDARLEMLKRFRVEKASKSGQNANNSCSMGTNSQGEGVSTQQNSSYSSQGEEMENNSIDEQVQSAIDSILNLQQTTPLDLDSILS